MLVACLCTVLIVENYLVGTVPKALANLQRPPPDYHHFIASLCGYYDKGVTFVKRLGEAGLYPCSASNFWCLLTLYNRTCLSCQSSTGVNSIKTGYQLADIRLT